MGCGVGIWKQCQLHNYLGSSHRTTFQPYWLWTVWRETNQISGYLMEPLRWGVGITPDWFRGSGACCLSLGGWGGQGSRSGLIWLWVAATAAVLHQRDLHFLPLLHLATRLLRLGGRRCSADLSITYKQARLFL